MDLKGIIQNEARREASRYIPRFLRPLIPGNRGTVTGQAGRLAKRKAWGLLTGCVFALLIAGAIGLGAAGMIAYIVSTTM